MGMQTRTKIDRLGVSLTDGGTSETEGFFDRLFRHLGRPSYEVGQGAHGFRQSARVLVGGAQVAYWLWGGASQKGRSFIDVSGLGCNLVDWEGDAATALRTLPGVRLKRVDIAADFYRGEVSYEQMLAAYRDGKFRTRRQPDHTEVISSTGRTLYVGTRGNDVFCRGYEKGRKEFAGLGRTELKGAHIDHVTTVDHEGKRVSLAKWFRVELELRAKTRPLPLEVVRDRDFYFAGAYPFLQELLPQIEPRVLVRPEHIVSANLEQSLAHIRDQWGSTLFTAMTVHEGDMFAVWSRIVGRSHNDRLVKAGALLLGEKIAAASEVEHVGI